MSSQIRLRPLQRRFACFALLVMQSYLTTSEGCHQANAAVCERDRTDLCTNEPRPERLSSALPSGNPDRADASDVEALDIRTVNLFHEHLARICIQGLRASYAGPLSQAAGTPGVIQPGGSANYSCWFITEPFREQSKIQRLLFAVRIHTRRRGDTVVHCKINHKELYISLDSSYGDLTINDVIPHVEGKLPGSRITVHELLERLGTDEGK
jgi:hypothetical protein